MKDPTRRAIAYIAGRLISGSNVSAVYDYIVSKYFNFSGDISPTAVSIYDHEQKCHISGSGTVSGNSISLYDYGYSEYFNYTI